MRYRILISDDEVDIVEMLTGFFRSKGYEVFSAYNGVETLKLAELQPDIILLDINMPKLDGIEVCKKITMKQKLPGSQKKRKLPLIKLLIVYFELNWQAYAATIGASQPSVFNFFRYAFILRSLLN